MLFIGNATALMVSPAKITGEAAITVTNNMKEAAEYSIAGNCTDTNETSFNLDPAERKLVLAKPRCNGYMSITEESATLINKFNIPVKYTQVPAEKRDNFAVTVSIITALTAILVLLTRRIIKGGGVATASFI